MAALNWARSKNKWRHRKKRVQLANMNYQLAGFTVRKIAVKDLLATVANAGGVNLYATKKTVNSIPKDNMHTIK